MHASQHKLAGSGGNQPLIPSSANDAVEQQLHSALRSVETAFAGDALGLVGSMYYGVEDFIRDALERRLAKRDKLIVIVDTEGGYIEVVQRIADTIRYALQLLPDSPDAQGYTSDAGWNCRSRLVA